MSSRDFYVIVNQNFVKTRTLSSHMFCFSTMIIPIFHQSTYPTSNPFKRSRVSGTAPKFSVAFHTADEKRKTGRDDEKDPGWSARAIECVPPHHASRKSSGSVLLVNVFVPLWQRKKSDHALLKPSLIIPSSLGQQRWCEIVPHRFRSVCIGRSWFFLSLQSSDGQCALDYCSRSYR